MSILDRLIGILPRGIPLGVANAENVTTEASPAARFVGLNSVTNADPRNPYHPPIVGDRPFPTVSLHPQLIPPGLRSRVPSGLSGTPGLRLGHLIAPGQAVRKGIVHPGRRLGRTGNPNVGVPGQTPPTIPTGHR